ncbi:MAG: T9SS type A sorting domain-containing protein [Bacteroidia bacterium]|nr:T9SS type A sorting domain-containing protein [Bacteroidia bacterium]
MNHHNNLPQPSFTTINIKITETSDPNTLTILNLNGKELLLREITESTTTINVSILSTGVYFVRLTGEGTVQVGKFIKR